MSGIAADESLTKAYCDLVSAMIMQKVESRKPSLPVYGDVIVSFTLNNDGALASAPQIEEGDNAELSNIAIKSIKETAPFPPFPMSMDKEQETFKITISYERDEGAAGKKLSANIENPIGQYIGRGGSL
jgi:TonB family protein